MAKARVADRLQQEAVARDLLAVAFTTVGALALAIALHTLSMLVVMAVIAWAVYKWVGLVVLGQRWINFDLVWAVALLVVGVIAAVNVLDVSVLAVEAAGSSGVHVH